MYSGKNICHFIEMHTLVNDVRIRILLIFDNLANGRD